MPTAPTSAERYSRHVRLRELGARGQARISAGAVAVLGSGLAAEEAALYLTAAGVGRLVLEPALAERLGPRLAELNPEVVLAPSAILAVIAAPTRPERRADGAKAALVAILALTDLAGPSEAAALAAPTAPPERTGPPAWTEPPWP